MKKRVLQFIGSFHQGGSERQAVALTRSLKLDGTFEIFAATLNNDGVLRPEIDSVGLAEIPEFPLTSFYDANFVRQARRCAAYLKTNRIDLVHTNDFYTNVFGMVAATLAGVTARIASKRETAGMRSRGQEFAEKLALGRAHCIVANCAAVRDHLESLGFSAEKIRVIYNGIDPERFKAGERDHARVRQGFGLPAAENIRLITMVANLRHPVKNIPMLMRAARRVIRDRPDTNFVIAGEGELEPELKEMAKQMGVDGHVHFTGRCSDVPALLGVSYACVLTSVSEGFANSILEYMAAGRPVVATRVGGAAEAIVDGETGYLVAADDDAGMAARILDLLENSERAVTFGNAGKKIVEENFSRAAQLRNTMELYHSLLGGIESI